MKRPAFLEPLGSIRLTPWLLAALGALFLLGVAIPQKAVLQRDLYTAWAKEMPSLVSLLEAVGLTDIHGSPVAYALWALFFANLLSAMALRLPGIVRRAALAGDIPPPATSGFPARRALAVAVADPVGVVRAFFAEHGYAVREREGRLRAVKNRLSPLATVLFHASFLVVLGGSVLANLTRFEGTVDLGEGETFSGERSQYSKPPRAARYAREPLARFQVEHIEPEIVGDMPVRVQVKLRDGSFRSRTIDVNAPYEAEDGTSFVFKDLGLAPLFVVVDGEGNEVGGAFMRLELMNGRTDRFQLMGQQFEARLFPDWILEGGEDATRSQEMHNPALRLTLFTKTGNRFSRTLKPGDAMELGPYRLFFPKWRYWVRLYVRSERGMGIVFAGFGLAALALIGRLLFYRRDWIVARSNDGTELEVAARSDFYRALFLDEFERVSSELARALERT